jgi:hypothetical protein
MSAKDVVSWIISCLAEAEADGYQQQEEDPIHNHEITFDRYKNTIRICVGDEEFHCVVHKRRKG